MSLLFHVVNNNKKIVITKINRLTFKILSAYLMCLYELTQVVFKTIQYTFSIHLFRWNAPTFKLKVIFCFLLLIIINLTLLKI